MKKKSEIVIIVIVGVCILSAVFFYRQDMSKKRNENTSPDQIVVEKEKDTETSYDISKEFYLDYDDTGLERFIITGVFTDVDTYIKNVREDAYCTYIYEDEEQQIIVEMTEQQKKEWIGVVEDTIKDASAAISEDDLYHYEFSDEYTRLVLDVSTDAKVEEFMSSLTILTFNAELYQIFSGTADWSINIVTKDWETGREISNINFPEEDFNVSIDMWEN